MENVKSPYQYVTNWPNGSTTVVTEYETPSQRQKHIKTHADLQKSLNEQKTKAPEVPTTPTKIDVKSGVGVPGGFSADTYKIDPSKMTSTAKASFVRIKPPITPNVPSMPVVPTTNPRVMPKIRNLSGDASKNMAKNLTDTQLADAQTNVKDSIPASELSSIIKQQEADEAAVVASEEAARVEAAAAAARAAAPAASSGGVFQQVSGLNLIQRLFKF